MFYSREYFPENSISYLQIQVIETLNGQIAFGIMP